MHTAKAAGIETEYANAPARLRAHKRAENTGLNPRLLTTFTITRIDSQAERLQQVDNVDRNEVKQTRQRAQERAL